MQISAGAEKIALNVSVEQIKAGANFRTVTTKVTTSLFTLKYTFYTSLYQCSVVDSSVTSFGSNRTLLQPPTSKEVDEKIFHIMHNEKLSIKRGKKYLLA